MNITSRNIITYFILSVFIFSSVGVTFHSSCCEGNKEKEFEKGELSCCEEIIIEETEEKCCESAKSIIHSCNNDCDGLCFTSIDYFKLDIDQLSIVIKSFKTTFEFTLVNFEHFYKETNSLDKILCFDNVAPILWGRSLILSLNKSKIPHPLSV